MATSKIYQENKVENTERKFGSALEYHPVKVVATTGEETWALFTETEIEKAVDRATKNKEDIPQSVWARLFK